MVDSSAVKYLERPESSSSVRYVLKKRLHYSNERTLGTKSVKLNKIGKRSSNLIYHVN